MATKDILKANAESIKKKKTGSSKPTKKTKKASNTKQAKAPKEKAVKSVDTKKENRAVNKAEENIGKSTKHKTINRKNKKKYFTHDGHELTIKERKFIDHYIATGNGRQSVIEAGYTTKAPHSYANDILNKRYIANEIEYLMNQEHTKRIATGEQVLEFFTRVMNGEEKDQFGLDAPLSERIKAGQEIAKRTVDIANKVAGVTQGQNEVTIKLDWDRKGV